MSFRQSYYRQETADGSDIGLWESRERMEDPSSGPMTSEGTSSSYSSLFESRGTRSGQHGASGRRPVLSSRQSRGGRHRDGVDFNNLTQLSGTRNVEPTRVTGAIHNASEESNDSSRSSNSDVFLWELFDGNTPLRKKESIRNSVLRGPEAVTKFLGIVGINLMRVSRWNKNRPSKFLAHLWSTRFSGQNTWANLGRAVFLGILVPTAINIVLTVLPLHRLSEPPGSDGFLPFSDTWGWLLQKTIAIVLVDLIFVSMEVIYLAPDDHFYFSMWPTMAKVVLTFIAQDFIPRALGAFPVPFLDSIIGPTLCGAVTAYHIYTFVVRKLPEYERGTAKPSLLEMILSAGRNTSRLNRRLKKYLKLQLQRWRINYKDESTSGVGKSTSLRRGSLDFSMDSLTHGTSYLTAYHAFQRRRLLTLVALILLYIMFYSACVFFLLVFRITAGSDSHQALAAVGFTAVSVGFRKFLVPNVFKYACYGSRWWDGDYYDPSASLDERYDKRVNASGFRLADYYFECLAETFLTFILPEISSNGVFVLIVLLEVMVILFTGASWLIQLPSWAGFSRKARNKQAVSPVETTDRAGTSRPVTREQSIAVREESAKKRNTKETWLSRVLGTLTGVPPYPTIQLIIRQLFHPRKPIVASRLMPFPHDSRLTMSTFSWKRARAQKVIVATKAAQNKQSFGDPTSDFTTYAKEWALRWLVPLVRTGTASVQPNRRRTNSLARLQNLSPADLGLLPQQSRPKDLYPLYDWLGNTAAGESEAIPELRYQWQITNADEEFAMLGWVIQRCQTLFVMFFADIMSNVSFYFLFSFMVYGNNKESFPYSRVCDAQFRRVMEYNTATILANILGIWMCDFILRCKLGISLIATGTTLFRHAHSFVPMIFIASLAYGLVWSFIVDHTHILLYFTERYGSLTPEGPCEA
eukprot:gb/GECG01001471.1/.p1 GENE.gb/GECG01001471.1/~~gb/GECG01001471.1/.p1  ORF type:complete len:922 (+),score=34.31 gb/GECG01001471.1/:1-2766(+)